MADPKPFPGQIIWLAITVSVFVYGVLAFAFLAQVSLQNADIPGLVPLLLAAGACGMALFLMKGAPPELPAHIRQLLIWVSLESVALMGMLAAWIASSGVMFLPYGLVALGLLLVTRPRS